MLKVNPKAVVVSGAFTVIGAVLCLLAYNQLALQKELTDQVEFNFKEAKLNSVIVNKLFPSPTATPSAKPTPTKITVTKVLKK